MYNKKVLVIENTCDSYDESSNIDIEEIATVQELVKKFLNDIVNDESAVNLLLQNKDFLAAIEGQGYKNIEKIKSLEEKVIVEKHFYTFEAYTSGCDGGHLKEINFQNLDAYFLSRENVILLQNINKESFKKIDPEFYKKFQEVQEYRDIQKIRREERMKKKEQNKKSKEIEKAKNLLKEAGEL